MQYLKPEKHYLHDPAVQTAARILRSGGIVAFPTETVYGLGACYDKESSVQRIFSAKGRPGDNPLIAHISCVSQLPFLVSEWPREAKRLADAFWPGPLTIVAPKHPEVLDIVTGGLGTVGVRMPAHPLALALIAATSSPLVAPSANQSGRPSPTAAAHVQKDLAGKIDAVLDGGCTQVGLESTVVGIENGRVEIYRPGSVTKEMLVSAGFEVVGPRVAPQGAIPPSPGMKYTHYSPEAKIVLLVGQAVGRLVEVARSFTEQGEKVGVLAYDETVQFLPRMPWVYSLGQRGQLAHAGQRLYSLLRKADEDQLSVLIVEGVERQGLGEALMNRLEKAASVIMEV